MTLGGGYMLPNGEGKQVGALGLGITTKAKGDSTRNAYSLFEYHVPAGKGGPPLHVHTREDESFICLSGKLQVTLGDEQFELVHGDYLLLPRDVPHTFNNPYDEDARVISVVSPAGLEAYYEALAALPPGPPDISRIKPIMEQFGLQLQGPPPGAH